MSIVRREERPVLARGPQFPTLQRLVDRQNGSTAMTVLINEFTGSQAVPEHVHEVEEILTVTRGECTVTIDGLQEVARTGDSVIIAPGTRHAIIHDSHEPCQVLAVLASPDVQIGPAK
ncbi:MAG TPA: cupin domain-containing protein [Streptosporangiaceae bacterium]|jgi:quercetin dioxygenase-like cupin family protein|nr:cupin domain-containing protein [Streptosporangiaceae bacterium]